MHTNGRRLRVQSMSTLLVWAACAYSVAEAAPRTSDGRVIQTRGDWSVESGIGVDDSLIVRPSRIVAVSWTPAGRLPSLVFSWWPRDPLGEGLLSHWMPRGRRRPHEQAPAHRAAPLAPGRMPARVIHVRLSKAFLERQVELFMNRPLPVSDHILGTTVHGTSHTTARTDLILVPDARHARTQLRITGTTHFVVAGVRGRVRIRARGVTEFSAERTLLLDGAQVVRQPTKIDATSRLTSVQCTNDLPGVRGWLVDRVATRRTARSRSQAERMTSRHALERLRPQIEQCIDDQVAVFVKPLAELATAARTQTAVPALTVCCHTGRDWLEVLAQSAPEQATEPIRGPSFDAATPDVEVHVHVALLREGVNDPDLRPLLQGLMQASVSFRRMIAKDSPTANITATPAAVFRLAEDGEWFIIALKGSGGSAPLGTATRPADVANSQRRAVTK